MKTKIIPFDLETAKKIQAGEIKGRIVTVDGEPIRVLAFDIKANFPIAVAVTRPNGNEIVYACKSTGKYIEGCSSLAYDLAIELPEEAPKHEFKPFDKVLVRNDDHEVWSARLYDMWFAGPGLYGTQDNKEWSQCIPYEGKEHLLGTTDKPKED